MQNHAAQIAALRETRSPTTTLISYYLRAGPNQSGAFLRDEIAQAANIKAKATRDGVLAALRAIQRQLKDVARIPDSGLCVFASADQCL